MSEISIVMALAMAVSSCSSLKQKENNLSLKAERVDLLYKKPMVMSNLDSSIEFNTEISYYLDARIYNKGKDSCSVVLDNLENTRDNCHIGLEIGGRVIKLYNYPFAHYSLPVENSYLIGGGDSIYIHLESPVLFSFKKCKLHTIDSLIKALKASEIVVKLNYDGFPSLETRENNAAVSSIPVEE